MSERALRFDERRPLAVIGAMPEETGPLLAAAVGAVEERVGPFALHRARLDGVPVLLVTCGIGKVQAAALTQTLLAHGAAAVLFTGVAGGVDPSLRVGDLVVADRAVQHDVDVTALGYARGEVPGHPLTWPADADLTARVREAAEALAGAEGLRVVVGTVASGDRFVADPVDVARLRATFGAACAEMEGAAVAQVCAAWGVPWAIVRSVSDTADHDAHVDFRAFTEVAAGRAVAVVRRTLVGLAG
ncbi:MAG: 5'-methylthioadenosine/adenosylhomocysteine nucleosidase [Trueperaceae bacterium]|nr:5'-methylthioadenosine/adenosylhomocysteine nucleosidase [Trueperaceae bacterium]